MSPIVKSRYVHRDGGEPYTCETTGSAKDSGLVRLRWTAGTATSILYVPLDRFEDEWTAAPPEPAKAADLPQHPWYGGIV